MKSALFIDAVSISVEEVYTNPPKIFRLSACAWRHLEQRFFKLLSVFGVLWGWFLVLWGGVWCFWWTYQHRNGGCPFGSTAHIRFLVLTKIYKKRTKQNGETKQKKERQYCLAHTRTSHCTGCHLPARTGLEGGGWWFAYTYLSEQVNTQTMRTSVLA